MGASRMIHHNTTCTIFSRDSVNRRNGSAALPALSAAMPMAMEITMSCNALKSRATEPFFSLAPNPKILLGITEFKNPSHDPVVAGSWAALASTPAPTPGWMRIPRIIAEVTARNAVTANHMRVCAASRAALVTCLRLAIDVTTAVNISGAIITLSSCT